LRVALDQKMVTVPDVTRPQVEKWILVLAALACSCASDKPSLEPAAQPFELASGGSGIDVHAQRPPAGYDPITLAAGSIGKLSNPAPNVPSTCYAKTDGKANTCAACHTKSTYPNLASDWELQQNYSFQPESKTNPWRNQFRDRRPLVARYTDADVLTYIRTDNYAPLRDALDRRSDFPGYKPDLDLARGFDADGFAVDGSDWRTVRFKPFVGVFWPTNGGSAGDVFIRLPDEFRRDAEGKPSREVYRTNLAILEKVIAGDPRRTDAQLALPAHYAGGASHTRVIRALYPVGVEFLHTVRYLDPDARALMSTRMKEVRYAKKVALLEGRQLADLHLAAESPNPPDPEGDPITGLRDGGWLLQGWIEDANGWLRLQTNEEHRFCMGCHGELGVTVDRMFSFARKVPGDEGWRLQDAAGIPDAPQVGQTRPEYAQYLERVGGGDDLRSNTELRDRWFSKGTLDFVAVATMREDISKLIAPSRERAIALDRAYLANVIEQSYVWGREASVTPATNVHTSIEERSTGLGESDRVYRDTRLQLDWGR
jgi:hypothetical protein